MIRSPPGQRQGRLRRRFAIASRSRPATLDPAPGGQRKPGSYPGREENGPVPSPRSATRPDMAKTDWLRWLAGTGKAHLPHVSALSRPGTGPVSGQLCSAPGGRAGHTSAGFLLPFGRRRLLPGHPVPPGASAPLTIGLPRRRAAARTRAGFPCSARMRYGWAGCLLCPGGSGARTTGKDPRPPPAASQRPAPITLDYDPPQDVKITRYQRRFTVVHPSQPSPRLWPPAERDPRAFP